MKATSVQLAAMIALSPMLPDEVFASIAVGLGLPLDKKTTVLVAMQGLRLVPATGDTPSSPDDEVVREPHRCRITTIADPDWITVLATSPSEAAEKLVAGYVAECIDKPDRPPRHFVVEVERPDRTNAQTFKVTMKIAITAEARG